MRHPRIAVMLIPFLVLGAQAAGALPDFLEGFNARYGTRGSQLDRCGLCHLDFAGGGERNAYGRGFEELGGGTDPAAAFQALEPRDPDGDGATSLTEIALLFLPGLACADLDSTRNGPAGLADFVEPRNVGCAPGVVPTPDVDVTPEAVDFGSVTAGTVASRTLTLQNLGDAELPVTDLVIDGAAAFDFDVSAPAAPFAVPPGGSVDVALTYAPELAGSDLGSLEILSGDPDEPSVRVPLSGIAVPPTPGCIVDLSAEALDFGRVAVGGSASRLLILGNTGGADCRILSLAIDGADFALGAGAPTPPFALPPGTLVDLPVDLAPLAAGPASGTLSITWDDGEPRVREVALTGLGAEAPTGGEEPGSDLDSDSDVESDSDSGSD